MNSCQLTATITAVANGLSCKFTDDEIAVLAAVFVQLGDTLATIAAQRSFCNSQLNNTEKS